MSPAAERGDFGYPKRLIKRRQVVGIFDFVDYTGLDSNRDLVEAVSMLENELKMELSEKFYWDDRTVGGREKETNNVLLRSTGDGYIVAFSENIAILKALQHLTAIHKRVHPQHAVRLGTNFGENIVVRDANERVNILGWGINLAARALGFAESGQIICTSHLARPLLQTDASLADSLKKIGNRTVKMTSIELYNYFKRDDFGAALNRAQRKGR